jgi:hypothetical protein
MFDSEIKNQFKSVRRQIFFRNVRHIIVVAAIAYGGYLIAHNPDKVGEFFGKLKSSYTTAATPAV